MSRVIEGMPAAEYHAHPYLGSSRAKLYLRSPAHAQVDVEETDPMHQGTALHRAVEIGPEWRDEYAIWTGGVRRGKVYDAWTEASAGKPQLREEDVEHIDGMAKAMRETVIHEATLGELMATPGARKEASVFHDELQIKARPDLWLPGIMVVDWKSTGDARPGAWLRLAANMQYHLSAAQYLDVAEELLFVWAVVERKSPYGTQVYYAENDDSAIEQGRVLYLRARMVWLASKDMENKPCYGDNACHFELPRWAQQGDCDDI